MDVVQWQIAVVSDSGNYDRQPGLQLEVELRCRVCRHTEFYAYAHTITPITIQQGYPKNGSDKSWFKFGVDSRLALLRHCPDCGTASIIPPNQAASLIALVDSSLNVEYLRQVVSQMAFTIERLPETEDYWARDIYRAGRRQKFTLTQWQLFEIPGL